jgi:hypothetical protein
MKCTGLISMCILIGLVLPVSAEDNPPAQSDAGKTVNKDKKPDQSTPGQKVSALPDQPVGTPPPKQESVNLESTAIFEQGGVLTPRHSFVFEPSLQYAHASSNRIAIVGYTIIPTLLIGVVDVRTVEDNTLVGSLSFRYGITSRLEGEIKVPYVYRTDSSTTQSQTVDQNGNPVVTTNVFSADGHGIGDVDFGLRYQVNQPTSNGAYFIAGVRAKSNTGKDPFEVNTDPTTKLPTEQPTGSGFWGIQPSLTVIFPSDPAVFFGSISYMYNIPRDIAGTGRVDPGDIVGFNFGMGFALNEKISLSVGYDHSVVGRVTVNDQLLEGTLISQVGTLLIGYSYKYNDKTSINVSLGAGLTQAAPDVQIGIRVPFNF